MARLTPSEDDQQQGDKSPLPPWLQLIDKWLHNPAILFTLFSAFLALLAALVLITGALGAALGALLGATLYPTARKVRSRANTSAVHGTTQPSEPTQDESSRTPSDNAEQPPDASDEP